MFLCQSQPVYFIISVTSFGTKVIYENLLKYQTDLMEHRCERSKKVGKSNICDISSMAFFFLQMNPLSELMFSPGFQNEKSFKGKAQRI